MAPWAGTSGKITVLAPLGGPGRVLQVLSLEVCDLLDGVHPEYPGADWIPNCSVPLPLCSFKFSTAGDDRRKLLAFIHCAPHGVADYPMTLSQSIPRSITPLSSHKAVAVEGVLGL